MRTLAHVPSVASQLWRCCQTLADLVGGSKALLKPSALKVCVAASLAAMLAAAQLADAATVVWNGTNSVSANTNWSTGANWVGGIAPTAADMVKFQDNGALGTAGTINNVVDGAFGGSIMALQYGNTNCHTTLLAPGVTLTIGGGLTSGTENDKGNLQQAFNALTGAGAMLVLNNTSSNLTVRQCTASGNSSLRSTLDLSGLDTLTATLNNVLVGQQISSSLYRATGTLLLARTNLLTLSGGFIVGDNAQNPGGQNVVSLGQTNALFADAVSVALSKGNSLVQFNSGFASPVFYLRGKTSTRVNSFRMADNSALTGTINTGSTGTMDLSGGTADAQVGTMYIGRGLNASGSGASTGVLTLGAGTFDADVTELGYQQNVNNTGVASGTINVNGTATFVVNTSLRLARYQGTGTAPNGTLNVNGGTFLVKGSVAAGGGNSTISVTGGTLVLTNTSATIGSSASPIATLNLSDAVLNLTPSTGSPTINVATLNSGGSANTINIFSLPNISSYPVTLHLLGYTAAVGNNALVILGNLPAASPAYQGSIVDNGSGLDLVLTAGPQNGPPSPPTGVSGAAVADGQIVLSWNASLGATSYNILRSATSGSGYTTLATGVSSPSFTDSTAADGVKRYYYEVAAVNGNGTSSPSAEVGVLAALQLRFPFEDTGSTTTDSISGATLSMVSGANLPTDYHGAPGSGANGAGKALDFSSNPYSSPATGPLASLVNSAALGFGTLTNFTVTFWLEPDSDFTPVGSSATNNPRLFALAPGTASDYGANPGVSLAVNNWNGTSTQTNGIKMNLNGTETSLVNFHTVPHYWTFVALTYDGAQLRLFSGSSISPVKLLGAQSNPGQALNFGAAGSLLLGNRSSLSKGADALFDDFRFYTVAADTNLLESIRQSATVVALSNLYPNGNVLLQGTNTLSFNATSPNGINANGFQVVVNGTDVSSQLVVGGTAANRTVSYAGLQSNQLYTASIKITDAAGAYAASQFGFDTFSPRSFTWEAEDFDFNGGSFLDNPPVDAYANQTGVPPIDESYVTSAGNHVYRPSDSIATDVVPDTSRQQYLLAQQTDPSLVDYYVGWWQNGAWLNYTRTYPTGTFNIYARLSGNIGPSTVTLSRVTSGQGTSSQTTTNLGTFSFVGNDANTYSYVPLRDAFGNLAAITLGGVATLRATTDGGANANFFLLVPAQMSLPVIANVYPDGLKLMEPATSFGFTASSASATINNGGIQLVLNGTNVSPQLLITGSANNKSVSLPGLVPNTAYTAVITVTDVNGSMASSTINFDTFSPTLVWEAEDYDFLFGQFIDNPVPTSVPESDSYFGQVGAEGVDYHNNNGSGGPLIYRSGDTMSTDLAGDVPRQNFLDAQNSDPNVKDYEVGYFGTGEWLNFTRTFPPGTYNLYARLAENLNTTGSATLSLVTNGWGTSTQITAPLGTFAFTGVGWQTYKYVPLLDSFGNLARITLSGTNTLRLTSATAGGVNVNFLMLVPARSDLPTITGLYPDGSGLFQATNRLSFTVSSPYGINTNNVQLLINGVNVSLVFSGSAISWTASYTGLLPNTSYTVSISATDNNGNIVRGGSSFDTFSPSNFTFEAEDFDFNGGQFIDNPVVSATPITHSYYYYPNGDSASMAQVGIDLTTPSSAAGEQFAYRPFESCGTQVAQDFMRSQFSAAGASDYNVGWWSTGTWLNYTRTFPANQYHLYARLAYNAAFSVTASLVTSGQGTPNQVSQVLGTFSATGTGFQTWQWVPLLDANSQLVTVSLSGVNTLKMTSGTSVNANFYMLVPAPTPPSNVVLTAKLNGANVLLSFPTQAGFSYTLEAKTNLRDNSWTTVSSIAGDGSVKSLSDTAGAGSRFYRLSIR